MKDRAGVIEPVVKRMQVKIPIGEAFRLFTQGMGEWWPLETHSIAADTYAGHVQAEGVVFEDREGGRIYERMSDGSEGTWGYVITWDPPTRVVFSWKPSLTEGPFTEVEVRFISFEGGTEVELEHRGWDRFGAEAVGRRDGYDSGWAWILDLFRAAVAH
jgi:uncharacterized protein YndB with AHSA1/START domain